jgi:hypothetical protein
MSDVVVMILVFNAQCRWIAVAWGLLFADIFIHLTQSANDFWQMQVNDHEDATGHHAISVDTQESFKKNNECCEQDQPLAQYAHRPGQVVHSPKVKGGNKGNASQGYKDNTARKALKQDTYSIFRSQGGTKAQIKKVEETQGKQRIGLTE